MTSIWDILSFGALSLGVIALVVVIFAPILLAAAWVWGYLSFQTVAIVLLIIAIYTGA